MAPERLYTLEEATALIGPLGGLIEEMRDARRVVSDEELSAALAGRAPGNGGGGPEARRFSEAALRLSRGIAQIERWGVVVRDLDSGICDFRSRRGGREVYLCWQVGEDGIGWWHELDAGFAGRRPIEEAPPPG